MQKTQDKHVKNQQLAVGYCRVSTDDQADNGLSLDYQEDQCKQAAKRDGYLESEVLIIRDEGKSGKNLNRQGIRQLLEMVERHELSTVYVTHSDRLARNIVDHALIRTTLSKNNVQLKYLNGQSSENDASSIMADNMFATINQYHSDNTREKTKQAVEAKARAGYLPTHAPIGYKNITNPNKNCEKVAKKIIVLDPEMAPLVVETFKTYALGQCNVYELNDKMFDRGLRSHSGKKLAPSMMYTLLKNKVYLGEIHWLDIHVKGKHEPLIDESTFNRVQSVIASNGGNRCKRRKYFWLLNGYVYCPIHGCKYTAEWHLNKSKAYYHCSNQNGCGKYVEKSELEKQVATKLKNLEFSEEFTSLIVRRVKAILLSRKSDYSSAQRGLQNQKNAWEAKLQVAEDRLFDQTIDKGVYLKIKTQTNEGITKIDRELGKLRKAKEIDLDVVSEILGFTRNIYQTYIEAPEELQRQFLAFTYERIEVNEGVITKERYTPLFEELLRLKALFYKSSESVKSFENKAESEVINDLNLGAYRDSNPN